MKRHVSIFIIALLLAIIGNTDTNAQEEKNGQLWFCWEATVNPALRSQFVDLQLDFHSKLKENGFPYTVHTWRDGNFGYYFFYPVDTYDDKIGIYNALGNIIPQWGEEQFSRMWETVQSHRTYFLRSLPEMSYIPEEPRLTNDEKTFAIWDIFYIRPDKEYEIQALGKKLSELQESKGYNDQIQMITGDLGYEGSVYIGVLQGKSPEDVWSQNKKMWELLDEEGGAIFQKWMSLTSKRDFKQIWYSEKLSYSPE
jgi:hypothetical protein